MIETIEVVYEKGEKEINEDAIVCLEEDAIFAVIDGATGLKGLSGKIASETLKEAIEENSTRLLDRIFTGNEILGSRSVERIFQLTDGKSCEDIPKEMRSSCSITAIQFLFDTFQMEYVHAGDCMIFVQYHDKSIRTLTRDHVLQFDTYTNEQIKTTWEDLLPGSTNPNVLNSTMIQEKKQLIQEKISTILINNRTKSNTKSGYNIVDGTKLATSFLESGTISLLHVKKILLLSDGLLLPNNLADAQNGWLLTAQYAFENGLHVLLDKVNELESNDPACFTFPRVKQADDKSGILLTLQEMK